MSIKSRLEKIYSSVRSRDLSRSGKLKLYENLKKVDLIDELHQRNVKFYSTQTVDTLRELLNDEMKGIQRVPALIVPNTDNTHLLDHYEILGKV